MDRPDSRTFLGFEGGFVSAVAQELFREHGKSLASLVVVVPGRRAGRKLLEALVREARGAIEPPRIVTEAGLARELSARAWTPASPALVEAAWLEVLARAEPEELAPFQPEVAEAPTWGTRVALARQLAALDRERAALHRGAAHQGAAPRSRLSALERLSTRVGELLRAAGRGDPAFALERVRDPAARRPGVQVVLAGVTELSPALYDVLETLVPPPRALIQADTACAAGFDALGGIVSAYWAEREIPLRDEDWLAVDDSAAAIRATGAWIQGLPAGTTTDELALGLPNAALLPGFAHALGERGLALHAAAGTAARTSAPWLALDALHAWIAREDFSALASALRHPDVEMLVRAELGIADGPACSALLDAWHAEHLPDALRGALPGLDAESVVVHGLRDAVRALCAELARADERPLTAWTAPIAEIFCRLFPAIGGEASPREHSTRLGLERFAELAHDLGGVAPAFASLLMRGEQALRLWLDWTADEALRDAPTANAVEALGWLELAMEEAPWLAIVGLNEGWVPESQRAHPLLGPESEAHLDERSRTRLARDVHALTAIARQRAGAPGKRGLLALSLRRGLGADPLRPSRLLFHAPDAVAIARGKAFYPRRRDAPRLAPGPDESSVKTPAPLPMVALPPLQSVSVSRFKAYLNSPYLDYLQNVLKLERVRDDAWEIDAQGFGSLVHGVLEAFGRSPTKDSVDAEAISRFLSDELKSRSRARFGEHPLPAVRLQLQQLERRLRSFARIQAAEAREGWRIAHVELKLEGAVLDVDGALVEIRGRVDRIDRHADGRWRILDYKTGDDACKPKAAHVTKNGWRDLQLPLYRHFLRERLAGTIELGYFALTRKLTDCGVYLAELDDAQQAGALDEARRVLRLMLAGDFAHVGGAQPADRVQRALCGRSLLALESADVSDDDAALEEAE